MTAANCASPIVIQNQYVNVDKIFMMYHSQEGFGCSKCIDKQVSLPFKYILNKFSCYKIAEKAFWDFGFN